MQEDLVINPSLSGCSQDRHASPSGEIFPSYSASVDSSIGGAMLPKTADRHLLTDVANQVINCPDEFRPQAISLGKYDLIISIDTEYEQNRYAENAEGKQVPANTILSYQYAAVYRTSGGKHEYAEAVVRTEKGQRLGFKHLLSIVCKRFGIGHQKAGKLSVLCLAHFGVAEWAAYADRMDYVPYLTPVRKVPVTIRDMVVSVPFNHSHYAKMSVCMRDTRLLTPGPGSLEQASESTNYKKIRLPKGWIEQMTWVSETHSDEFDRYAINDARVTLEYYLKTILEFERLTGITEAPLTLGDAAVKVYLDWLAKQDITHADVFGFQEGVIADEFGKIKKITEKCPARVFTETLAAQAFLGGLNIAFETGLKKEPGYIYLDIDFSGAYPAALASLHVIDWSKYTPVVTPQDIVQLYKTGESGRGVTPIVLLHVDFEFPEGAQHACLPVASPYGLLYPRIGTTTCTGPEVALALELGAKIEIRQGIRFLPVWDADMEPRLAFAEFLSILTKERAKHPDKKSLANRLLKEIANSFFGKLAQSVEQRNVRNLRGKSDKLRPSRVTCPHYAALCTGIVRAALSAVIHCAEQFPDVRVLSATTDGCMLRIPFSGEILFDDFGEPKPPALQDVLPGLYQKLNELYPIKLLRAGRENMGLSADGWLESKHVGDEALTVKTRGYLLRYQGKQTFLAKCGHKIRGADELQALYFDEDIKTLAVTSLVNINDIAQGKHVDLVSVTTLRRVNTDYDYKRILQADGTTRLADTAADIIAYRTAADGVRRSNRRATSDAVELYLAGVRQYGGTEAAMRRQIVRAIAHNIAGWRPKNMLDREIAEALGISVDDLKNAKRRKFLSNSLPSGPLLEKVIKDIATKLKLRVTPRMRAALVSR